MGWPRSDVECRWGPLADKPIWDHRHSRAYGANRSLWRPDWSDRPDRLVMPAYSDRQRRAAGMALAAKRGEGRAPRGAVAQMARSMSESQLRDFARKSKRSKGRSKRR